MRAAPTPDAQGAEPEAGEIRRRLVVPPENPMNDTERAHAATVRAYFDACNTGDGPAMRATLAPDVVHYFLAPEFPPVRGADELVAYWARYLRSVKPWWTIDRLLAQGDELVSEWSCAWSPPGTSHRLMARGTEWYRMRDGLIAEVRAYFIASRGASTELAGFPYGERGYARLQAASPAAR